MQFLKHWFPRPPVSLPLALARTTFLSAPLIAGRRVDLRLIPHRAPERTMGLSAIQAAEKRREGKAFFSLIPSYHIFKFV